MFHSEGRRMEVTRDLHNLNFIAKLMVLPIDEGYVRVKDRCVL